MGVKVVVMADEQWVVPALTAGQRRDVAARWLRSVGVEVTEARVGKLAPVVLLFDPRSPRGQIASALVGSGVVPTAALVEEVYARQTAAATADQTSSSSPVPRRGGGPVSTSQAPTPGREDPDTSAAPATGGGGRTKQAARAAQRARRAGRVEARIRENVLEALDEAVIQQVRGFVAQVRAETGAGPTWSEVGRHLGWSFCQVHHVYMPSLIDAGILTSTRATRSLDLGPRTGFPEGWDIDRVRPVCIRVAARFPALPDPLDPRSRAGTGTSGRE